MSSSESSSLQSYALELLAYSVYELFPNVLLLQAELQGPLFSYEFVLEQTLNSEILPLIEETLKKNLKATKELKISEMIPQNAAALFHHLKQPFKAEEALACNEDLIKIVKISYFHDICPFSLEKPVFGVPKLFSLKTFKRDGLDVTRIEGTVFSDLKSLKNYTKIFKKAEKIDPRELAIRLGLIDFPSSGIFLLPRGESLKESILSQIKKLAEEEGYTFFWSAKPPSYDTFQPYLRFGHQFAIITNEKQEVSKKQYRESFFDFSSPTYLKFYCLGKENSLFERCISSLQFIEKTIKIFDLNREWVLCEGNRKKDLELFAKAAKASGFSLKKEFVPSSGVSLELRVSDRRLVSWSICTLNLSRGMLVFHIGPIERLLGLLIEKTLGDFPFWLVPEQVRILPVDRGDIITAENVKRSCQREGIRTGIDLFGLKPEDSYSKHSTHLAERLSLALQHRVPYILMVGEKEKKENLVTLREWGSKDSLTLKLEEFFSLMKKKHDDLKGVKYTA